MKFAIPEISWHNRDPVLSVDFQPKSESNGPLRLATGGTDSHVLIWYLSTTESGSVNLEVAADLTKHQKAVNVVRWSPNGQFLASGDDESIIFIWKQKNEEPPPPLEGEEQYKETWVIHKTLRGHMEDILDISWSLNSAHLASGSVDNKLLVWDVNRGRYSSILTDHKGFVQGVSWDPRGQLIATASTDRVFRTFDVQSKKVVSRSSRAELPLPPPHPLRGARLRLYHDDTLQTYYRRLHFSPDGLLIAVPAGRIEPEQGKLDVKPMNAVYIYTRYSLKVPACILPCAEPALVVRWSGRRYRPRASAPGASAPAPAIPCPARMVLAVATKRSLMLYDTQQKTPIAIISNIHYTRLTDLTWSPDGRTLVAASTDGFCSIVTFGPHELGDPLPHDGPTHPTHPTSEPMEVSEEPPANEAKETEDPKPTSKIDAFMKFKTPSEKSPKKQTGTKTNEAQQKTPVKIDVLVETAMPSWSDNSSSEIIKPKSTESMEVDKNDEITIIEDSEDIKLVYDETENKSQSPKEVNKSENKTDSNEKKDSKQSPESAKAKTEAPKKSPERKRVALTTVSTPSSAKKEGHNFFKQAKVTDMKEQVSVKTVPSPKAPRRVNFVTLSSPKNKKKC